MNKRSAVISLFLFLCVFVLGFLTHALLSTSVRLGSTARLKTVGCSVWVDANATVPCTAIDWGIVEPNSTVNRIVYVRNDGNVPVILNVYSENWQPQNASEWIHFSTDYDGVVIQPLDMLAVAFMLYVDAEVLGITDFSFDIVVRAIG